MMSQAKADHLPAYQVFPSLSPEDFDLLKRDIVERGVQVAIEHTPKQTSQQSQRRRA
jgi:hypothetical protein